MQDQPDRLSRLLRYGVGLVRLVHPFPVSVVMGTSLFLIVVAHGGNPGLGFLCRACAVVLLTQIPVGALNDFLDRGTDQISQPDKPIPSGLVRPADALWLTLASLVLFVPLALSFGLAAFGVISLGTAGGLAYDLWLKPTPWAAVGYIVGFLSLATWVWLIAGRLTPVFAVVYPPGALLLVAAHLANSYPDIEIDRRLGHRGLAVKLGSRRTLQAIVLLYGLSALGGALLSLLSGSPLALVVIALSTVPVLLGWIVGQREAQGRAYRKLVFRLIAPGIGLLGLGCLIALSRLT